jgi:hypothetical protein
LGEIVEKNPTFMPVRGIFIGIYAYFDGLVRKGESVGTAVAKVKALHLSFEQH